MTLDDIKAIDDLEAYKEALERHDWTYAFSDDHRWYCSGMAVEKVLKALADKNGTEWKYAYNEAHAKRFCTNIFHGGDESKYHAPYPEVWPF
jgi:hypothetical protein